MAEVMYNSLPQHPHELWQTAASAAILPAYWATRYSSCPRCGGNAPNECTDQWPDNWWDDFEWCVMFQGHIPPPDKRAPWDDYYTQARVEYAEQQAAAANLHIDIASHYGSGSQPALVSGPMTPPTTPGPFQAYSTSEAYARQYAQYGLPPTPGTPTPHGRSATWDANKAALNPSPYSAIRGAYDETPRQRLARTVKRAFAWQ